MLASTQLGIKTQQYNNRLFSFYIFQFIINIANVLTRANGLTQRIDLGPFDWSVHGYQGHLSLKSH